MNRIKEDLLLHPVRMRIMQAVGLRQVTARELARELPDVPQATLYRHINALQSAGILDVVKERRVHNTIEKTYALAHGGEYLTPEDMKDGGPEDHVRVFTRYLGQLLGYFTRYVEHVKPNVVADRLGFQMFAIYLSEAEMLELGQSLNALLVPHATSGPSPERRRFILGFTLLPDVASAPAPGAPDAAAADGRAFAPDDKGRAE